MIEYWNDVLSTVSDPIFPPPPTLFFERFVTAANGFFLSFQNSIDMLFVSTWPYKGIHPFQAYILGVATPVLTYFIYLYVTRRKSDIVDSGLQKVKCNIPNLSSGLRTQNFDKKSCKQSKQKCNFAIRPKLYPPLKRPRRRYYDRVYRKQLSPPINENRMVRPFAKRAVPARSTPRNRIVPRRRRRGNQFPHYKSETCQEEVLTHMSSLFRSNTNESFADCSLPMLPPALNRSRSNSHFWEPYQENPDVARLDGHSYELYHHMNSQPPMEFVIDDDCVKLQNQIDPFTPTPDSADSSNKENCGNQMGCKNDKQGKHSKDCMKETNATDLQTNSPKTPFATSMKRNHYREKSSKVQETAPKSSKYNNENKNDEKLVPYDEFERQRMGFHRSENDTDHKSVPSSTFSTAETTCNKIKSDVENQGTLLVLVSHSESNPKQKEDQDAALQFLEEWKIPFELVDGTNSSQNDRQNELLAVSGVRGQYPQFFIDENNGPTVYLGQRKELEYLVMSEYDLLSSYLAKQVKPHFSPVEADSKCQPAPLSPLEEPLSIEYFRHLPNEALLILLISSAVCDRTQEANQKAALQHLRDLKLPFKLVDGMSHDDFERRDDLFRVSGIRGGYPQFFAESGEGTAFLGQLDDFESLIRSEEICPLLSTKQQNQLYHKTPTEISTKHQSKISCNGHLIVLISIGVIDRQQSENQDAALKILEESQVPFEIIDGMDPSHRDSRDFFFKKSGIRGHYPQFFDSKTNSFLGGFDWLRSCDIKALEKKYCCKS